MPAVARLLAGQFAATRLERGFIQTALKVFYGFMPRAAAGNGSAHSAAEGTGGHEPEAEHAAPGPGHGH